MIFEEDNKHPKCFVSLLNVRSVIEKIKLIESNILQSLLKALLILWHLDIDFGILSQRTYT